MSKVLSNKAMSLMAVSHTAHDKISWNALWDYIADLEEFKAVVAGCGFEVITEPPVLNHPERKILKGHGTIYVPELPELPEVQK